MPGKDRTRPEAIDKRKHMAQALQLRETGANYRQITQALDISTRLHTPTSMRR